MAYNYSANISFKIWSLFIQIQTIRSKLISVCVLLTVSFLYTVLKIRAKEEPSSSTSPKIIRDVTVEGNRIISDKQILDLVTRTKAGDVFDQSLIVEDLKDINGLGYFIPEQIAVEPMVYGDEVDIVFVIKEKPVITNIYVSGYKFIKDIQPYQYFSNFVGMPFNEKVLSKSVSLLNEDLHKKGYLLARVRDIQFSSSSGLLNIILSEGIVGKVAFTGNEKTEEKFLNRRVSAVQVGRPYNELKVGRALKKLNATGYYEKVNREVEYTNPSDDTYNLTFSLEEKRSIELGLGGGASTGNGLFGNVNVNYKNIKGKGQNLGISGTYGGGFGANATLNGNSNFVRNGQASFVNAYYSIPYIFGTDNNLVTNFNFAFGNSFAVDFSEIRDIGVGLSTGRYLDEDDKSSYKISLNYHFTRLSDRDDDGSYLDNLTSGILKEDFGLSETKADNLAQGNRTASSSSVASAVSDARSTAQGIRDEQLVRGSYLQTGFRYNYTDLDNKMLPRDGVRWYTNFEPHIGFGEIDSFYKLNASMTKYFKLPFESSFLVNARAGTSLFDLDIPQFSRFRLGAANGVRGYRPLSQLGFGDRMFIATTEIRTPIYNLIPPVKKVSFLKPIDFAVFSDFGFVGGTNKFNSYTDRLSRAMSTGFGLRFNLPFFGRLRVDMGFPLIEALINPDLFRINFGPADNF